MYMLIWDVFPVTSEKYIVRAYTEFAFRVHNAALLSARRVSLSGAYLPKINKNQSVVLNTKTTLVSNFVVIHNITYINLRSQFTQ